MADKKNEARGTRFFMTHHGPMGAWSSLTFGLPGRGASIDTQRMVVDDTANLLVGVARGKGQVRILPFYRNRSIDPTTQEFGGPNRRLGHWRAIAPAEITRRLAPCVDEYRADGFAFRTFSPLPALPDPREGATLEYETCPAILLELEVDNTGGAAPCWGFLAMEHKRPGSQHSLAWVEGSGIVGMGWRDEWALAAEERAEGVHAIRGDLTRIEDGTPWCATSGDAGGLMIAVPAGERRTLTAAFGFYHHGPATQGIPSRYWYAKHFPGAVEVCRAALGWADRIRNDCRELDAEAARRCADPLKRELFSQSVRAYAANASLLAADADGKPMYSVCEGQFEWRNTLDLAADHLPWELWRNPWVVRNIMDFYIDRYSYRDQVRFGGEAKLYPGGIGFAHDMGNDTCYTPPGGGGYEKPDDPFYSFMTTEELLNGAYCAVGYALVSGDREWAAARGQVFADILTSLQNRDGPDAASRTGLPKGETSKVGGSHEITTYDCLDPSLKSARGNLYIAVKAWCAYLLLAEVFDQIGGAEKAPRPSSGQADSRYAGLAAEARAAARLAAGSLAGFFDAERGAFPSNLAERSTSTMIAAVEPMGVPLFLGLGDGPDGKRGLATFSPRRSCLSPFSDHSELIEKLSRHVRTCLQTGNCVDAATGCLRLVSSSTNTWPSKGFLSVFVLEDFFGIDVPREHPTVMREFAHWMQVTAAERTCSDQIEADTRKLLNGSYYPRMVTSSLWLWPRAAKD